MKLWIVMICICSIVSASDDLSIADTDQILSLVKASSYEWSTFLGMFAGCQDQHLSCLLPEERHFACTDRFDFVVQRDDSGRVVAFIQYLKVVKNNRSIDLSFALRDAGHQDSEWFNKLHKRVELQGASMGAEWLQIIPFEEEMQRYESIGYCQQKDLCWRKSLKKG